MKLKLIYVLYTLVFCIFHSNWLQAESQKTNSQAKHIEAIENGLQEAVYFAGDPSSTILQRMQYYGVPGVSIAVINDYKIDWVKHYGVTDKETGQAVDHQTLFQAGSISKPVAAYGALKLVEKNKLALDAPVNQQLKGWQIPDNQLTKKQAVALKHLLSHSAGLTVHGFGGYPPGDEIPSVIQVLNGEAPANSGAVRVNLEPETQFRYSGGGYTVMQKLMTDVTAKPFPALMDELVHKPLKMTRSTFAQPLPPDQLKLAAAGYLPNKQPVPGKRHTYPEMADAGLWTTAEDLAKFAVDIQLALKSGNSQILNQKMVEKMLTPFVSDQMGLGLFLQNRNGQKYFGHGGWDEGFSADFVAHKTAGYGVVIMTNSNHPAFIEELKNSVAKQYKWTGYLEPALKKLPISDEEIARVVGRYDFSPDMTFRVYAKNQRLFMQYLNDQPMEIFRIGENQFIRREYTSKFRFEATQEAGPVNLVFGVNNEKDFIRKRLNDDQLVPFERVMKGELTKAEASYKFLFLMHSDLIPSIEENLLTYAQTLNNQLKPEQGLQVLQLCSRLFPLSENSQGSLAEQHLKMGHKKLAIQYYKKALEISPNSQQALKALKSLEQ